MTSLESKPATMASARDATIKRLLWQGPARAVFSVVLVFLAAGIYTIFPILRSHDIFFISLLLVLFIAAVWGFENLLASHANPTTSYGVSVSFSPSPLLKALNEELFQLEAERRQGKLNQREYQIAKGVLDKTLQRAMKN